MADPPIADPQMADPQPEPMLRAAEAALAAAWDGPVQLDLVERFESSSRAVVLRASVAGPTSAPATVIVKAHVRANAPEEAVREPAGLALLTGLGSPVAPKLLAVAEEPALVVIEDLGAGSVSLADLLLGSDPQAAADGLLTWASTMGVLHAQTAGAGSAFGELLAGHGARLGEPPPAVDDMPAFLASSLTRLPERLPEHLGVVPAPAALEELRTLADLLPGDLAGALTPADACPDNNALGSGGMVLFDFEGTAYRHVAWDASYLLVPWPTCWCSWRIPETAALVALDMWREKAGLALPVVLSEGFNADLSAAVAGWTAMALAWYLPRAAQESQPRSPSEQRVVEPTGRALLLRRLRSAVERPDPRLPALHQTFEASLAAAVSAWGDEELPFAPAFR